MSVTREVTRTRTRDLAPDIGELRPAEEIVPRFGAKPGLAVARVGSVTAYDRTLQEISGSLAVAPLRVPLRLAERRHMLIVAFVLEPVEPGALMRALIRSSHPDGTIWIISPKSGFERPGVPTAEEILKAALGAGWVDNKLLPIGDRLAATRFAERRPGARSATGGVRGRQHF
jgi:hypothetical protein